MRSVALADYTIRLKTCEANEVCSSLLFQAKTKEIPSGPVLVQCSKIHAPLKSPQNKQLKKSTGTQLTSQSFPQTHSFQLTLHSCLQYSIPQQVRRELLLGLFPLDFGKA